LDDLGVARHGGAFDLQGFGFAFGVQDLDVFLDLGLFLQLFFLFGDL
jgi:hypothetical protein